VKRGKKFLFYISSITFCCLFMLFFSINKVEALEVEYSSICYIRSNDNVCDENTNEDEDIYFALDKVNITNDDNEQIVVRVPQKASVTIGEKTFTGNIEVIGDNSDSVTSIFDSSSVSVLDYLELEYYLFAHQNEIIGAVYVEILDGALSGVVIDSIVCLNHGTYNYYKNILDEDEFNLVTVVKYNFYPYQKKDHVGNSTPIDSITYHTKDVISIEDLPIPEVVSGLKKADWYLYYGGQDTKLENNLEVIWEINVLEYNIYPKYEFDTSATTFIINSVVEGENQDTLIPASGIQYNGKSDLAKIKIKELKLPTNAVQTSISWYKIVDNARGEAISKTDFITKGYYNDSGIYECVVAYQLIHEGYTYTSDISARTSLKINKAPLYISVNDVNKVYGVYLNDTDISYIDNGLLNGDNIVVDKVEFNYPHTGNINAGTYSGAIKVVIKSILDENTQEKLSNYDVIYSYGDYIVSKKNLEVYYEENVEAEYGENIVISKTYKDEEKAYGIYDNYIVVTFARENGCKVEEYDIIGVKDISNSNYNANYVADRSIGKVIITPKKVKTYIDIESDVYDGNSKKVSVYYEDVNGVRITVPFIVRRDNKRVNEIINAGNYAIDISSLLDDNYDYFDNSYRVLYFEIKKADTKIIDWSSSQTFTYTGEKINPFITINNDEQVPVYDCKLGNLQGDYCINAGSYNVSITYPESDNYNQYTTSAINLKIEKYKINLNPKTFTFYYGEDIEIKETINIHGEDVIVEYFPNANSQSMVGDYDIVSAAIKDSNGYIDHVNYEDNFNQQYGKGKVKIVKRPVTIVYYNYEGLVYNGKERVVGAYAVDNISNEVVDIALKVVCDEGQIKDAKTYHLRSYFTSQYYVVTNSNLLVFSIAKAKLDLSSVKFEGKDFTLDFKDHSISVDGELPEGVEVKYYIDGEEGNSASGAFSHTVVAKFFVDENNYFPLDSMEATIYIDMTWLFVTVGVSLLLMGIAACLVWVYVEYRRSHPKKIKLKIKNLVTEDLAAKRVATSVKEVLGDEEIEAEHIEDDDDIIEKDAPLQNFIDRIYAADSELKYYYSEIKNELLSYDGITHNVDRKYEVFYHGTRQIAKISICNNVLRLYVNLDPNKYDKNQYNHRDMSKIDIHSRTPLRLDVNTTESLRHGKVFIRILRKKENLKAVSNFVRIDYEKFYTLKENFFAKSFKKMFSNKKKNSK